MPSLNPDLFGYLAGILTTVAFVPQVLKTWRTRSAEDLSMGMLVTFTIGVSCWLAYGLALRSAPMILANGLTLVQNVFLVAMKARDSRS
jgi:MtN3 and saliva related transmembrane protein